MPGNTVKINNFEGLEFYVGDSKMDGLMEYLNKHGIKQEPKPSEYKVSFSPIVVKAKTSTEAGALAFKIALRDSLNVEDVRPLDSIGYPQEVDE